MYEGQQHWLHYRHIEQERNQFLGFFFTLLVAIVGFFVAVSSREPTWPELAMGLSIMAAVLGTISLLIFASVRKFGAALLAYDRDIARVRESLFELVEPARTHLASEPGTIATRMRPMMLHRVFDPQFSAEVIVGTSAALAAGVQVFVAVDSLVVDGFSPGQQAIACALAAVSVAGGSAMAYTWIKGRKPQDR
ncbi:hypothetical protein AB0K00_42865 [Dactylosporangium sp. NPDC049525]|uniref:hypothetical protein n=1 Tax=Dactylosporangium sp. NPDC049525 TaxID=3154730 RepID=UPI003445764A